MVNRNVLCGGVHTVGPFVQAVCCSVAVGVLFLGLGGLNAQRATIQWFVDEMQVWRHWCERLISNAVGC